jgi:hypothetical protein
MHYRERGVSPQRVKSGKVQNQQMRSGLPPDSGPATGWQGVETFANWEFL